MNKIVLVYFFKKFFTSKWFQANRTPQNSKYSTKKLQTAYIQIHHFLKFATFSACLSLSCIMPFAPSDFSVYFVKTRVIFHITTVQSSRLATLTLRLYFHLLCRLYASSRCSNSTLVTFSKDSRKGILLLILFLWRVFCCLALIGMTVSSLFPPCDLNSSRDFTVEN